jgi:acyl-CoA thioesterase-2
MGEFVVWDREDILAVVTVEPIGGDRFVNIAGQRNAFGSMFGGQFMGLALQAASLTVDAKAAHFAAGFFLKAGDASRPVVLVVERSFDGRNFASRRVTCLQADQPLFYLEASFQTPEAGVSHGAPMPDVPTPEALAPVGDVITRVRCQLSDAAARKMRPPPSIELRPIGLDWFPISGAPSLHRQAWIRLPKAAGATEAMQRSLLAYVSDYVLAGTAVHPHEVANGSVEYFIASLNQCMWFYRPIRTDEWLLCSCSTPAAASGRGLGQADFFDRSGQIVASAVQEVLMRPKK